MRRWSAAGGLGVALATGLVAFSCRQVVGIGDERVNAATASCGLPYPTTDCASCIAASCCAESTACAGDQACNLLFACLGGCSAADAACRSRCWARQQLGPGTTTLGPLFSCESAHCATACTDDCSDIAMVVPPDAAAGCVQCMAAADLCPAELACGASVECMNGAICWAECFNSADCSCTPSSDAGAALYAAAGVAFLFGKCRTDCQVGSNWSCVGKVAWPGPSPDGSTLTVQVDDPVSAGGIGDGIPGVGVAGCYANDLGCGSPFKSAVTDVDGSAILTVPGSPLGRELAANNFLKLTADASAPTLYYWPNPVSQSVSGFISAIATTDRWQTLLPSGIDWDYADRGIVYFNVSDCTPNGTPAAGVQVTLDALDAGAPPVSRFYSQQASPSASATATDGMSGFLPAGAFVNVPPGLVTLTATPVSLGRPSSVVHAQVHAGTVTFVTLLPTP